MVTDNGIPAKSTIARVIVKVLDENDNKPQFLQKFYKIQLPERGKPERERAARREPIYRVIAADKDEGPNAEISYSIEDGDEHGKFFIEPKTGVVSSKKFSAARDYDILSVSQNILCHYYTNCSFVSIFLTSHSVAGRQLQYLKEESFNKPKSCCFVGLFCCSLLAFFFKGRFQMFQSKNCSCFLEHEET